MTLEKAELIAVNSEAKNIQFMFNPAELSFEGVVETADNPGARSEASGKPKISFSNIKAYRITISDILFDTYETRKNVLDDYIQPFRQAVEFVKGKSRPPIYTFKWGNQNPYLKYCFIEKLNYKFTMFLPDGTPVRAVINSLTLKETDNPEELDKDLPPPQTDRANDTMSTRSKKR